MARVLANSRIVIRTAAVEGIWDAWTSGQLPAPNEQSADDRLYQHLRRKVLHAAHSLMNGRDPTRTGLILATTKGDIDSLVSWMRTENAAAKDCPTLGAEAAALAGELGIAGPPWVVSAACASGLVAIIDAALALLDGDIQSVLVLALDVAGDFVRDGFTALKAISPAGNCRPFDAHRDGLMLGSGSAAALLSHAAPAEDAACILTGWGAASDAVHLTAPDRDAGGLIRAIDQALAMAHLPPADIDVLIAHGTATRYNDAMEAVAIEKVFLQNGGKSPAITAVKGLIGHTLGASGVIETALAAKILQTQTIPAIPGLQTPEWPHLDFVRQTRTTPVRHILKIASGFGGLNAALILSRPGAA